MSKYLILASFLGLTACVVDGVESAGELGAGGDDATEGESGNTGGNGAVGGGGEVGSGAGGQGTGGEGAGGQGTGGADPCPPGVVCVTSFPFTHASSTATGATSDELDLYSCGAQDESGPEVIYRVDIPSEGFLTLDLPEGEMGDGVDIDLHLLGSLDANDCIDRGHWTVGELVPAGRYYVVADTWVSGEGVAADGAYTLEIGLTTVQDLQSWGMSASVAADALHVFDRAWTEGEVETTAYAVVDFALHASERRMWIFDVLDASLQHHTFTTVGDMSDPNGDGWAEVFSNQSGSHQSSLGLMKGAETYTGTYGKSLRLDGLEPGYNDNIRSRAIVLHPWNGSAPAYVGANPATGAAPTWGCLGVDPAIVEDVRDFLREGGLVLSHFPDGDWSTQSSYLP